MRKVMLMSAGAVVLLLAAGCASIIHGGTQNVPVNSTPEGASVTVYDQMNREVWSGTAPCTIPLDRSSGFFEKARYRLEVSKEGYAPKSVYLTGKLAGGWYLVGNFFVGGLIGWLIIDPATGGMWRLDPKQVSTRLEQQSAAASGAGIQVVLRDSLSDEEFRSLQPEKIR